MSQTDQEAVIEETGEGQEEQAEKPIGGPISKEEAIKIAEEQGGSREELEAQAPEESTKPKPSDELKVVIILKADKVMLGVQSPDCDPVYTTLQGTLAAALKRIPKLVDEAKQKWSANPRYPKANLPTPEPRPTPVQTQAAPKSKPAQPSFF